MRVIAGSARGRKLVAPEGRTTRPITDRAKEGIFNMIEVRLDLDDVRVVDLFAGSGSFGIECISRGAAHVTFVDRDRTAQATVRRNLSDLGFDDQATVVGATVESALMSIGPVDLAFCDPPYADDPWQTLLDQIEAGMLVGHADTPIELTDRWVEIRRKKYGRAHVVLARRSE